MHYTNYSVEDFAADEYFIRWVSRQDAEAEKFWKLFISLHPELQPRIERAKALVLALKHQPSIESIADHQVDSIWQGIDRRVDDAASFAYQKQAPIRQSLGMAAKWSLKLAAAFIAVAVFIAGFYLLFEGSSESGDKSFPASLRAATEDFVEEVNTGEGTIRIHLADCTVVYLEKNSRLRYKEAYAGAPSRDVFLTGKAFFKVAKNPRQPFLVHTNEVVTKVLGTSFSVEAFNNQKNITVAVTSGKVSVFSPKKVNVASDDVKSEVDGVVLLPNQQVVYQRDQESFEKTLIETPAVLLPTLTTSSFNFENTALPEVFHVLEDAYGVEIIFDEKAMKTCFITAPLGSEPLFEKLRIICRTIGANYEIIDTKVVINSSGCQ
jgi:transmembrane sensor